ncbi:MAG: helix-turn-helix transcriptional regulator [Acutalibacteraceae bacterium]|nr:helix-turn-helix transcriptional regulator [Acutalibacteraceae bacterium]
MTGEEIKEMRVKAGLTQQQLASLVGVAQTTVWAWEVNRKQATTQHIKQIKIVCKAEMLKNSDKLTVTLIKQTEKAKKLKTNADTEYQQGYADGYSDCVQTLKKDLK